MFRYETVEDWVRREALVLSALGLASALIVAAVALGVREVGLAGLFVAALAAAVRFVTALNRTGLERKSQHAELDRRTRVPISGIDAVDPTEVGVDAAAQEILPGDKIPEYVPRQADEDLRAAVRAAIDGSGRWIVVAEGTSKVGKSRALFEALRHGAGEANLDFIAPRGAAELKSLLDPAAAAPASHRASVLWLDDLEPYLNQGVTLQTLQEWHAVHPRSVVAATYGGKGNDKVGGSATDDLATIAGEVLQHAEEIEIRATNEQEIAPLRAQLSEGSIAAIESHGLAAYLVAGQELKRTLTTKRHAPGEDESPQGVAVVRIAVDWARCGRTDPVPEDTLLALWPDYVAEQGATASGGSFEDALRWATKPVAGTIALVEARDGYRAYDYVAALIAEDPSTGPPADSIWPFAIAGADGAQALAVGASAFARDRKEDAVEAFRIASRASNAAISAVASVNLAIALGAVDKPDEEMAIYDDIVRRFGDSEDGTLREAVARALFNKAVTLGELGRIDEEMRVYEEMASRFREVDSGPLAALVARGLVNKSVRLGELGRIDDALATDDEVVRRFGSIPDPAIRAQVAKALANKGVSLEARDAGEALAAYEAVLERFGEATDLEVHRVIDMTLVNRGLLLGTQGDVEGELASYDRVVARSSEVADLSRSEAVVRAILGKGIRMSALELKHEALALYEDALERISESDDPKLGDSHALALVNKALDLSAMDRREEAIAVYDEMLERFGDTSTESMPELVVEALTCKAIDLYRLERREEAVSIYTEVVRRAEGSEQPRMRAALAKALIGRALALSQLERHEEALEAYDEVVRRFDGSDVPSHREAVARALAGRAAVLDTIDNHPEEINAYDALLDRFDDDPALLSFVVKARVNKGFTLVQDGRPEEAIDVYDEVEARYGEVDEPYVREAVARSLGGKAVALLSLGRHEEGIGVCDVVVTRYDGAVQPDLQRHLAKALAVKAETLHSLERGSEAVAVCGEIAKRFDDSSEQLLREAAAWARTMARTIEAAD